MRKLTTIIAALLISATATFAQAPQGFSYQAVVRDAQNAIVANQTVDVGVSLITIIDGLPVQTYTEHHSVKTNANGLLTLTVGRGESKDKIADFKWDMPEAEYYIETVTDYGVSTTRLLSVPFALYAAKAAEADVDLSGYALKTDIPATPDLSGYALKTDIPAEVSLEEYAKTADIEANYAKKADIPASPDLSAYAQKSDIPVVPTKISAFENDANYLTAHQDISGKLDASVAEETYYSKTQVDALLSALKAKIPNMVANGIALANGEAVDLGLTSGILWATCNLGASMPEEYGNYYAWGETTTKANYTWSTYKYGNSEHTLTKYCNDSNYGNGGFTDKLTTLEQADDAATAVLGESWAMPTAEEFTELYNQCYWLWTTDYNGTGKAGYIVYKSADKTKDKQCAKTSNHEYSTATDTHVFLPAAGVCEYTSVGRDGSEGNYWTASCYGFGSARDCWFASDRVYPSAGTERERGFPIRPIRRP